MPTELTKDREKDREAGRGERGRTIAQTNRYDTIC
jgi:hypothetical protein